MHILRLLVASVALASAFAAQALPIVNRYRSPRNAERPLRKQTTLIVLHTTEAPAKGSLRHLSERGECHYCVDADGTVYRIVDRRRVAYHAGTSMWDGKTEVDNFSIGIECVGYHDKAMPLAQLKSIRELVKELQKIYKIKDDHVVTHGQVAYGEPNKWQKKKHRGRKRCGMLFAMPSVRRVLDLKERAKKDPDVRAKRLVVGDTYLEKALYGKTDTMSKIYAKVKIDSTGKNAKPKPAKPSASFAIVPQTIAQLYAQGYESIGTVSKERMPYSIAGEKWNAPDTFYTIRSRVTPGNALKESRVEDGMTVWRKKKGK
ncbi:MAG: N-acetylmuramoyl-L-alanine amidase [Kiritimatiellae bacterium]|nr:N-acetylmuramoyl-L-alanine amidase [Kiritimatiellia bacterium]